MINIGNKKVSVTIKSSTLKREPPNPVKETNISVVITLGRMKVNARCFAKRRNNSPGGGEGWRADTGSELSGDTSYRKGCLS